MCESSIIWVGLVCFFLRFGSIAGGCLKKPMLFNFGDSNSDTGGAAVLGGKPLEFPEGRAFFHEPTGRASDGRLILDFLCESLETKFLTPYLELFSPDFSNGVNFALAGSDTLRGINPYVVYTLRNQISEFSHFRDVSLRRGSIDLDQFKSALYMLDIGQNDIQGNFESFEQVRTLIPDVISNIRNAMQTIYQLGGRNFWVHNTGPSGCLPSYIGRINASTVVDDYGCVSDRNRAASELNSEMERLCGELRSEMGDATIAYVDIYSIKLDLIANATSYGFENPFVPCRRESVCPQIVSWDGTHYTEAANVLIASKILSTTFSTPPLNFNFFCNN